MTKFDEPKQLKKDYDWNIWDKIFMIISQENKPMTYRADAIMDLILKNYVKK